MMRRTGANEERPPCDHRGEDGKLCGAPAEWRRRGGEEARRFELPRNLCVEHFGEMIKRALPPGFRLVEKTEGQKEAGQDYWAG